MAKILDYVHALEGPKPDGHLVDRARNIVTRLWSRSRVRIPYLNLKCLAFAIGEANNRIASIVRLELDEAAGAVARRNRCNEPS